MDIVGVILGCGMILFAALLARVGNTINSKNPVVSWLIAGVATNLALYLAAHNFFPWYFSPWMGGARDVLLLVACTFLATILVHITRTRSADQSLS